MFKKISFIIAFIIMVIINCKGQASWNFVGPRSTNQLNNNGFETSQMSKVVTSPLAPTVVFASSKYGGLWASYTNGGSWYNVDMAPTGLAMASAIAFKNGNELLVGNYQNLGSELLGVSLAFSNRVSSYNFWNQTWTHYPELPTGTNSCVIKSVIVHPANQDVIYAGTSIGLFRYDGSTWNHILTGCKIESIVFTDNSTCYVSGQNMAAGYPNYETLGGTCMIYVSENIGNTIFQNFTPNIQQDIPANTYPKSNTEICIGAGGIFALTWAGSQRFLHKIVKSGSIYTKTYLTAFADDGGEGRMGIAYDATDLTNPKLWVGDVHLKSYNINLNSFSSSYCTYRMGNGLVHYDIHCIHINNNDIWVACDGGIANASLANPNSVSFNGKNNGIHVSLIHSFSGSEQEPNIYALGGQDIVNIDIYDESIQKNKYTHKGGYQSGAEPVWENDGAFIYKFDDNLMIFDQSFGGGPNCNNQASAISTSKGNNFDDAISQLYKPIPNINTFQAGALSPLSARGRQQKTLQDPFRPGRIYQLGVFTTTAIPEKGAEIFQYVFNEQKFVSKCGLGPWFDVVEDMSFSLSSKNSVYAVTSYAGLASSWVFKYIGLDFDDYWEGHNSVPWLNISPDYLNFSSIISGADNFTTYSKIYIKKIETSPWRANRIYIAGVFGYPGDPLTGNSFKKAKVLTYDGTNWTNYSAGIPEDAFVYSMIMDHYSNDALYLSTSKGVYYKDASMLSWVAFTNGLQNFDVVKMEINYKESTVRLGTYGYGIWKSPLQCPTDNNISMAFPVPPGIYQANTILSVADHAVIGTPNVLRATNYIELAPGFDAIPSASGQNNYFFALIHGCNGGSSSPYLFRSATDEAPASSEIKKEILSEDPFKIFPNPGSGKYTFKPFTDESYKINIYNSVGALMRSLDVKGSEQEINIEELSPGIYFFNVKSISGSQKVIKVIKE